MGDVVNSIIHSGITIARLQEFDTDVAGNNEPLSGKGIPLSYLLVATK
jgi:hypothetical protein